MAQETKTKEVRIKGVAPKLHQELKNIAANQNITMTSFLKPYLRKIANEFTPEMKLNKKD